jgi:hypothetical protein
MRVREIMFILEIADMIDRGSAGVDMFEGLREPEKKKEKDTKSLPDDKGEES